MFKNLTDAVDWFVRQVRFREKTDLSIMKTAFNKLNIDLSNIKKVHIGGTNGKGSTNAFLSEILIDAKYKVGSFTSPYLIDFNERLKINNKNIEDLDLLNLINYFYKFNEYLFEKEGIRLSFFEMCTLMSFKYFSDEAVDVMIIEVGIGGRLDATNILDYDVSIITSIGYDHINQLGDTLSLIGYEKVSILKKAGYLVTGVSGELKDNFINYANNVEGTIEFINENDIEPLNKNEFNYLNNQYYLKLLGDYQRMNAMLARKAALKLYDIEEPLIIKSLKKALWQGRLEEIAPNVYIDGAHNEDAIKALARNLKELFKGKKTTILYSALRGKDVEAMLEILKTSSEKIVLTAFPDFRYDSLEPFAKGDITFNENALESLNSLITNQSENDVLVVTGSLHFIGYIKKHFNKGADLNV